MVLSQCVKCKDLWCHCFFSFNEPNAPQFSINNRGGWFYLVSPFPSGLHTHSAEWWVSKVMGMIWNVTLKDKMLLFNRTQTRVLLKRQSLFEQRTSFNQFFRMKNVNIFMNVHLCYFKSVTCRKFQSSNRPEPEFPPQKICMLSTHTSFSQPEDRLTFGIPVALVHVDISVADGGNDLKCIFLKTDRSKKDGVAPLTKLKLNSTVTQTFWPRPLKLFFETTKDTVFAVELRCAHSLPGSWSFTHFWGQRERSHKCQNPGNKSRCL